jgi:signal transduction histidine kinase
LRVAVSEAATETRETIRELRTLLVDIYPPTLQRSGLRAALADLAAPLRSAGIEVTLDVSEDADLPEATEALFYRVAQETIRNARKHGDPSRVRIELARTPHHARFSVADDGRGFSPTDVTQRTRRQHFGLRLMQDLVDDAGGTLEIETSPGIGTTIIAVMPWR